VGDIIDLSWNVGERKLTFARRHGLESCEVVLPEEEKEDLRFYAMVTGPGDAVEIVE